LRSETALVSRKSELRQLKNDLIKLDRSIHQEELKLERLVDPLTVAGDELDEAKTGQQLALDHLAALRADLATHDRELERLRGERQAVETERESLERQQQELSQQLERAQLEMAGREEQLQMLQLEIEQAERNLSRAEHRLQTLEQR